MFNDFSPGGTTERRKFLAWLMLASGVWTAAALLLVRIGGYGASVVAGLLAGLALAKVRIEAVRRLRDAGFSRGIGLALGIGLTVVLASAMLRFVGEGPDLTFASLLLTGVAAALVLLLPGGRSKLPATTGNGLLPAIAIVVACGVLGFAMAAWSNALQTRRQADADRAGTFIAVPDPLAENTLETVR